MCIDEIFIDILFPRILFGDGYIAAPLLVTPVLIFSLSAMLQFYESYVVVNFDVICNHDTGLTNITVTS